MKVLFCFLFVASLLNQAQAVVVGKINLQKIMTSVNEGKTANSKLKADYEKKQKELRNEEAAIKKLEEKYKKQSAALSDKAKLKKQREMQEKVMKLQQKSMSFQKELSKMEQDYKKPIVKKIDEVTKEISKQEKVDFTVDVVTAPLIYAKESVDLTDKVIKAYNKKYPGK